MAFTDPSIFWMSNTICFTLISLGCAKNQVDSEIMIAALRKIGISYVENADEADLVVINTCGFIEAAKEQSIETVMELRKKYPDKILVMAGCLSQRYGNVLEEELQEVDALLCGREPDRIVEVVLDLLEKIKPQQKPYPQPEDTARADTGLYRKHLLSYAGSCYIKISDGCDNRCSYCAIPLIKGRLQSRGRGEILDEMARLLAQGVFEFNLVAQDLGSYGLDRGKEELVELIEEISRMKENFWLRLLYIHPDRFPIDLLDLVLEDERILPYFDIPFQHASEAILKAMGRRGNSGKYLDLVEKIRQKVPESVIRSTFMVGFPGEHETDFEELLAFQKRASLDWVGVFAYSPEEGTEAVGLAGSAAGEVVQRRKRLLEQRQTAITEVRMDAFVGRSLQILIEEAVENSGFYLARGYLQAPEVDGMVVLRGKDFKAGELVQAKIVRRNGIDLEAVPLR